MNDTTRDDRLEKDRERRQSDPEYREWRYNNDLNHVEAIYEFVDRKVAEAVAARDAEMREALLSDRAKNASAHEMQELSAQGVIHNHTLAFYGMKAALTAAGITGAGQEGGGDE